MDVNAWCSDVAYSISQAEQEAERARIASEKKRDDALENLLAMMAKSQEDTAKNPEGLAPEGGLSLSAEDMEVLNAYLEERKREKGEL